MPYRCRCIPVNYDSSHNGYCLKCQRIGRSLVAQERLQSQLKQSEIICKAKDSVIVAKQPKVVLRVDKPKVYQRTTVISPGIPSGSEEEIPQSKSRMKPMIWNFD